MLTDYRAMFGGLFQGMLALETSSVQRIFTGVHSAELGLVWAVCSTNAASDEVFA